MGTFDLELLGLDTFVEGWLCLEILAIFDGFCEQVLSNLFFRSPPSMQHFVITLYRGRRGDKKEKV